jgi:CRISPR-associated protein Csm1
VGNSLANLKLWKKDLFLNWHTDTVPFEDFEEGFVTPSASDLGLPLALRYTAHYVPRLSAAEQEKLAYQRALSQEGRQTEPGDIKTFEHIALDALEAEQDTLYGEDLLGIIKADVDRLGAIFSMGVQQPCLGLIAGLSRMMDFFFTARLPQILQEVPEFHSTYVVYAGGDDLLLIGPWRQSLKLLHELRQEFQRYVGTPQITISAAMELAHPDEPLNRSVRGAEERLERAKNQGKNRVCAISAEAFAWDEFETQLKHSEDLVEYIRSGCLSRSFVYKMLAFDRDRMACMDGKVDSHAASWRARWGYHVKRNLDTKTPENLELLGFLNSLFGLNQEFVQAIKTPSARTAITVALYRNRKFH